MPNESPPLIAWTDPAREAAFDAWMRQIGPRWSLESATLAPASADASFRRYFRVHGRSANAPASFIVMDAAPPLEDTRPFVRVATLLREAGLHVPQVLEAEVAQGFLLLGDLGRQPYLQALSAATPPQADALMRDALLALVQMQQRVPSSALAPYDEALLMRELDLFPQWCAQRHFGVQWAPAETEANVDEFFAPSWKEYGTVDGTFYAAPLGANMKSFVWYSPSTTCNGQTAPPSS